MSNLSSVRCPKCATYVDPTLTPGEDFTTAACPKCQEDLTYPWHLSQQASGPLRIIGWAVLGVLVLLLGHACSRLL